MNVVYLNLRTPRHRFHLMAVYEDVELIAVTYFHTAEAVVRAQEAAGGFPHAIITTLPREHHLEVVR